MTATKIERVYKKDLIRVLTEARAEVKKPFGWAKNQYSRMADIKIASTEHELVDVRGVLVPPGEKGLFAADPYRLPIGERVNCVCAVGAVQKVVGEERFSSKSKLYSRALDTLIAALPKSYLKNKNEEDEACIEEFNDLATTTQAQVVGVFSRAINALENS